MHLADVHGNSKSWKLLVVPKAKAVHSLGRRHLGYSSCPTVGLENGREWVMNI